MADFAAAFTDLDWEIRPAISRGAINMIVLPSRPMIGAICILQRTGSLPLAPTLTSVMTKG